MPPIKKRQAEIALAAEISNYFDDPLAFVLFAYPWGVPGTILADETGPDQWQRDLLMKIKGKIQHNGRNNLQDAIREAVASGHGIGKSALVAWIIQWFLSTRQHAQVVVTANTETQLNTKTWREVAKWHKLLINRGWFEWTATKFFHVEEPETWFASAITWSERNAEAFAGTHERDVLMIFDEASSIPDIIWDTAEGAMTTPGAMWFVFGNMTRAVGKFVDCFEGFRHRWDGTHIDSRTAKKANHKQIEQWIEDFGEDSDFVRIRVRGVKPRSGSKQFISHETVFKCHQYTAVDFDRFPKLMSVDVARSGACESVITNRQGRKVFAQKCIREQDSMILANFIAEALRFWRPQLCFIEGNGLGGPIIDRLRQLGWGDVVIEVNPGTKLTKKDRADNHRSLWWCEMKKAMEEGLELPKDPFLDKQLTMVEYTPDDDCRICIQAKEDMAYSPDRADGVMLTFCQGNVVIQAKDMRLVLDELPMMDCA